MQLLPILRYRRCFGIAAGVVLFISLTLPMSFAKETRFVCNFDRECISSDGCSDTTYELDFVYGPDEVRVEDVSSSYSALPIGVPPQPVAGFYVTQSSGITNLLTTPRNGGIAHFTSHIHEAEMSITYVGKCSLGKVN